MRRIFADTFYWIAELNPRDQAHARAVALSKTLQPAQIITTDDFRPLSEADPMGVSVPRRFAAVGKNDLTDRNFIEYGPFFPPFPYCAFRIVIEPDPLSRWWTARRSRWA
jgi:hypothetical protein